MRPKICANRTTSGESQAIGIMPLNYPRNRTSPERVPRDEGPRHPNTVTDRPNGFLLPATLVYFYSALDNLRIARGIVLR